MSHAISPFLPYNSRLGEPSFANRCNELGPTSSSRLGSITSPSARRRGRPSLPLAEIPIERRRMSMLPRRHRPIRYTSPAPLQSTQFEIEGVDACMD